MGRALRVALLVGALLLPTRAAFGEQRPFNRFENGFIWGFGAFEVATTTALLLRSTVWQGRMDETAEGLLWTAPMLVGTGTGIAAGLWCFPPEVAFAVHGGLYTGLAVGLATGLARGAFEAGGTLRFQSPEGIAALIGTVPGLFVGALAVDPDDPLLAWMAGPPVGMLAGTLGAVILVLGLFIAGDDPGPGTGDQVVGWPIFAGLATGLVVATGSVLGQ